jgi:hypothetical protein
MAAQPQVALHPEGEHLGIRPVAVREAHGQDVFVEVPRHVFIADEVSHATRGHAHDLSDAFAWQPLRDDSQHGKGRLAGLRDAQFQG